MTTRRKKQPPIPAAPPAPTRPMDAFTEGMFSALKELGEVLWERKQGMHRLESALRNAPAEHQQIISDVLEPLAGGVQENVLGTVRRRLEDRLMREAQRRMGHDDVTTADAAQGKGDWS